ncbi:MAG: esterase/lipase family protein [Candidatus Woesearchaeota archaeon]
MGRKNATKTKSRTKKRILIIIALAVLLIVALYILFGLKIHFVFNEEMDLELTPVEGSYNVTNGQQVPVTVSFTADTPVVCKAYCTYTLRDVSSGKTIDEHNVTDPRRQTLRYNLTTPSYGEGQQLYQFVTACHSEKTDLCRSSEKTYRETSLITINYHLNETEKRHKNTIRPVIENALHAEHLALQKIMRSEELQTDFREQIEGTNPEELETLEKKTTGLNHEREDIKDVLTRYVDLWKEERYMNVTMDQLSDLESSSKAAMEQAKRVNDSMRKFGFYWNEIVMGLDNFSTQEDAFQKVQSFYLNTGNDTLYHRGLLLKRNISVLATKPMGNTSISLKNLSKNITLHQKRLERFTANQSLHESDFKEAINETNHLVLKVIESYDSNLTMDVAGNLTFACGEQSVLVDRIKTFNGRATDYRNKTYPFLENVTATKEVCKEYQQHVKRQVTSEEPEEFTVNKSYEDVFIEGHGGFNFSTLQDTELQQLCPLTLESLFPEKQRDYCREEKNYDKEILPKILISSYESLAPNEKQVSSSLPRSLSPNKPTCCFRNNCTDCCDDNPECGANYPIIFVHGHALSKSNSPELSLVAFSQLQKHLQEEGYIDAGEIADESRLSAVPKGDWGRINTPVSVRVSYYYLGHYDIGDTAIVTQKTERIENYAIRLKEFIDLVKYRTGSDQVIIISHSMGGLVSREYVRLFSPNDVDSLVMIGTPNHGIEGSVKRYCSVTGASKECEDMETGSIFLRRLNTAQRDGIPGTDVYTIRGSGCEMDDDRDGDGVVLSENVPLEFATNYRVNGTCPESLFEDTMHTRLVRPEEYPEVYKLIIGILEQSQEE